MTKENEYLLIETEKLKKYEKNSRKHSKEQIKQIIESIKNFGFIDPIIIDENFTILAGHGRYQAAKELNLKKLPCVQVKNLSVAEKKAYVIADNQIALNSTWDYELLKIEIEDIAQFNIDVDILGFDTKAISNIFDETKGIKVENEIINEKAEKSEITVKFDEIDRVLVMNAINEAIKDIKDAEIHCI